MGQFYVQKTKGSFLLQEKNKELIVLLEIDPSLIQITNEQQEKGFNHLCAKVQGDKDFSLP
jgi:hypothetical protein